MNPINKARARPTSAKTLKSWANVKTALCRTQSSSPQTGQPIIIGDWRALTYGTRMMSPGWTKKLSGLPFADPFRAVSLS